VFIGVTAFHARKSGSRRRSESPRDSPRLLRIYESSIASSSSWKYKYSVGTERTPTVCDSVRFPVLAHYGKRIRPLAMQSASRVGRHLAAWLGLVPRQQSSGGKERLLGFSKRGDTSLRTLLIHGARSVLLKRRCAPGDSWLSRLAERRNPNVAAVALANKNARVVWALLAPGADGKTRIWIMLWPKSPPFYKQMPGGNFEISYELWIQLQREHKVSSTVANALRSHFSQPP
jgi:hypothetical protein